jgi:hypothetical protein
LLVGLCHGELAPSAHDNCGSDQCAQVPIAFKSISVLPINLGTTVDAQSITAAEKKYSREMSGGSRVWRRYVVLRVCEFEGDEAEMLSAREYF